MLSLLLLYMNAYLQYYKHISMYNLAFSLVVGIFFGLFWGIFIFGTLGFFIGTFAFTILHKNQYYFYYNLGITRLKLLKISACIHLIFAILASILMIIIHAAA